MLFVPKLKCPRCAWEWTPRVQKPKKCPHCGYFIEKVEDIILDDGQEEVKS